MKKNEKQYIDNRRRSKQKKKKSRGILKGFLLFICALILAVAVFLGVIKFLAPDFDFMQLVPEKAVVYVSEQLLGNTTTTTTTTTKSTTVTTTAPDVSYLEISDFKFEQGKKGAYIGNLLNGGKVDKDGGYIYHICDGKGIYKFYPENESYQQIYSTENTLSSFNIRGDYFYFVDESDNVLYRLSKGGKEKTAIKSGISFAYIYDSTAYCITKENQVLVLNVKDSTSNILYSADADKKLSFVGISLDRVFFTVEDQWNKSYYCALTNGEGSPQRFHSDTKSDEMISLSMENGFMYYYQKNSDNSYSLIRRKYGSQKTVTLDEKVNLTTPVIIENNKCFYSKMDGNTLKLTEYNMNSKTEKVMLSSKDVYDGDKMIIQHGGEYDFIIGTKNNGKDKVYKASSNLTSSTNVMNFKKGSWNY